MANRRMFNKEIVSSDKFIDMPLSSQLLFFHLGINADDDGFVSSPNRISRSVGCSSDDIKILIAKCFVVGFESGVVVISDWCKHNQIRKDRYTPTMHIAEKESMQLIEFKQCQPNGNQMATTRQPSIVKVSVVESIIKDTPLQEEVPMSSPIDSEKEGRFERFWTFYNYKKEKKKAKANFMKLSQRQIDEVSKVLGEYIANTHTDGTFPSRMYPARYLNPKSELWNDEIVATTKSKAETTAPMAKQKTGVFAR